MAGNSERSGIPFLLVQRLKNNNKTAKYINIARYCFSQVKLDYNHRLYNVVVYGSGDWQKSYRCCKWLMINPVNAGWERHVLINDIRNLNLCTIWCELKIQQWLKVTHLRKPIMPSMPLQGQCGKVIWQAIFFKALALFPSRHAHDALLRLYFLLQTTLSLSKIWLTVNKTSATKHPKNSFSLLWSGSSG